MSPNILKNNNNFFLIAGPCVVEDPQMPWQIAEHIDRICKRLNIEWIFKASYRKANRSRIDSFTGIGDERALTVIQEVGKHFGVPCITDVHNATECERAAAYVDVLQIPAFLCRQTDLLMAAGATGKLVNIKKGQFIAPESMGFALDKVRQAGSQQVMLTERGTTFGYQDLVVDFRSIPIMQNFEVPVILDITHSLQQPNQSQGVTGGHPQWIGTLAKAGIAIGVDGIFVETHPNPATAKSDGANMLALNQLEELLETLVKIRHIIS